MMKLVDANILIYAVDEAAPLHQRARKWLEEALAGPDTLGFSWLVLLAFVRLTTRAGVFNRPLTMDAAMDLVELWLSQPGVTVVHPTARHAHTLRQLLKPLGTAGNLTNDAHLAALAIEHGGEVCSCDADFQRFSGLRWHDPLRKK
jgi:toxin-antitoxin system PIN domain toxin